MSISYRALAMALASLASAAPAAARNAPHTPAETDKGDILITAQRQTQTIENAPSSRASIDADTIATTTNAVNVEDALKYLPSLVVRKRHIGDTQAPLATRTSGLGASARSLIYADGALLSALIGNNNTSASPRWSLVSTEEIARIDVLYGPYSAAYPGNSIGAVVNITTRLPDKFEATLNAGTNVQTYELYGTSRTLPAYQLGGTVGDRFGPLAVFASVDHVDSKGQPLGFVTATRPSGTSTSGAPTAGGFDDVNRTNGAIRVLGASGFEHQVQNRVKLKAALDLSSDLRLTYVGSLFLNDSDSTVETYLHDQATGAPVHAGSALNIDGRLYSVAASAFSGSVYHSEQRHWSHNVSLTGSGGRFDWQVIGTFYDVSKDIQRIAGTALPAARDGGAGTITKLDGTGWKTFDAKGAWRSDDAATHAISFGLHGDWFEIDSNRYNTSDWIHGSEGVLALQSSGKTRTYALWAQDAWRVLPALTLTVGGRYEWWKAHDGVLSQAPTPAQPELSANRFSPKASLAWDMNAQWRTRLSFGQAWRFPTVGELYQVVTSPVLSIPNANLRPERARALELAVERHDTHGTVRLSLFNEVVKDALISQTGPLAVTPPVTPAPVGTFVQNVDRTRARGVELAVQRTGILPRVDVSGSVTYADAITSKDTLFPAAVGKLIPSVPHWKATGVVTWRPVDAVSLTTAARYASRNYGSLDNSDVVGNTYQGFYRYFVIDLRAQVRIDDRMELGLGVDNINNDKYFLFHPFPQRSFTADVKLRL
jgi:iron complex outermembrane receptor protein